MNNTCLYCTYFDVNQVDMSYDLEMTCTFNEIKLYHCANRNNIQGSMKQLQVSVPLCTYDIPHHIKKGIII